MIAPSEPVHAPETSSDRLREAWEPTRAAVAAGTIPSAVVAVATADRLLGIETVAGPRAPRLRSDGIFFLASLTKPIVATAVMVLADRGVIDLDEPIGRWVPAFRGAGKDRVTAWHVLTHTAGVPDISADTIRRERPTAARMLETVCREPLRFEPGTRYEYCSASFYLLAELLARATDRPFPEALRSLVLGPAGMIDTSFDPRYARRRIVPVEGVPFRNVIMRELVLRFLVRATLPGGGLWATAEDLVSFGQALLRSLDGRQPSLLSAAAVERMTSEQTQGIMEQLDGGPARDPRYGLGWGKPRVDGGMPTVVGGGAQPFEAAGLPGAIAADPPMTAAPIVAASPRTFTHGGATGTRLWVDPDRDLVFVFLTNLWGAPDAAMFATLGRVYELLDDRGTSRAAGRG